MKSNKIIWGNSDKSDGQMILRLGGLKNREIFFKRKGIPLDQLVSADLIHGNLVTKITKADAGREIKASDGLVTDVSYLPLSLTFADCLPLYFFDEKKGVIGLAHAGWRGVVKEIAILMIETMVNSYSSQAADISVYIGPHLQVCHFEIKDDILTYFKKYQRQIIYQEGKIRVNLAEIVKKQLIDKGISPKKIEISSDCTYCQNNFFSFRRDKPKDVMAQIAYIMKK